MKNFLLGVASGIIAVWARNLAEPALQLAGELAYPPSEDELELAGADATGRPENMPAAVITNTLYENLTGNPLRYDKLMEYSQALRYTEGALAGVLFSKMYSSAKVTGAMNGLPVGLSLFSLNHLAVLPRLGIQEEPQFLPKAWWVWQLGSSLVFAGTLVGTRKLLGKIIRE